MVVMTARAMMAMSDAAAQYSQYSVTKRRICPEHAYAHAHIHTQERMKTLLFEGYSLETGRAGRSVEMLVVGCEDKTWNSGATLWIKKMQKAIARLVRHLLSMTGG